MGIAGLSVAPYLPDFRMIKRISIVFALSAGWILASGCGPNGSRQSDAALAGRQKTAKVEQRSIEFSISVAGEIGPAEQVSVRPEVNGRISEMPVDIGDRVKKGELLFSLDDKELQIELETRKTEISSAVLEKQKAEQDLDVSDLDIEVSLRLAAVTRSKLELKKATDDFERHQKLYKAGLISEELNQSVTSAFNLAKNAVGQAERNHELARERVKKAKEKAVTNHQLATNAVRKAERNLDLTRDRISKTRIMAPFDCTVLTRPVSVGQAVSGSGGFNSGTEVLTIADLNEMIINAHVNQADITRLRQGMEVDVQVEAVIGLTVKGMVERIAPKATIKNGIKGFEARILLKEIDPRVQPGMTAKISIPVVSAEDALAIPLAAVFTEPEGRFVYVIKDGIYEQRPIRIGVSDYQFAEILSGLKPGETVSLEAPGEEDEVKALPKKEKKGGKGNGKRS